MANTNYTLTATDIENIGIAVRTMIEADATIASAELGHFNALAGIFTAAGATDAKAMARVRKLYTSQAFVAHCVAKGVAPDSVKNREDVAGWKSQASVISKCGKVLADGGAELVQRVRDGVVSVTAAYDSLRSKGGAGNGGKTLADRVSKEPLEAARALGSNAGELADGTPICLVAVREVLASIPADLHNALATVLADVLPDDVVTAIPAERARLAEARRKAEAEEMARAEALAKLAEMEAEYEARRKAMAIELGITEELEAKLVKEDDVVVKVVAASA